MAFVAVILTMAGVIVTTARAQEYPSYSCEKWSDSYLVCEANINAPSPIPAGNINVMAGGGRYDYDAGHFTRSFTAILDQDLVV